jgi:hypothetical protein
MAKTSDNGNTGRNTSGGPTPRRSPGDVFERGSFVNEKPALQQPIPSGTGAPTLPPAKPAERKDR